MDKRIREELKVISSLTLKYFMEKGILPLELKIYATRFEERVLHSREENICQWVEPESKEVLSRKLP